MTTVPSSTAMQATLHLTHPRCVTHREAALRAHVAVIERYDRCRRPPTLQSTKFCFYHFDRITPPNPPRPRQTREHPLAWLRYAAMLDDKEGGTAHVVTVLTRGVHDLCAKNLNFKDSYGAWQIHAPVLLFYGSRKSHDPRLPLPTGQPRSSTRCSCKRGCGWRRS